MNELKLAPPWIIYARKVKALFEYDDEIEVQYDDDLKELKLLVNSMDKADALLQLLPAQKEFGNIILKIIVVPLNQNLNKVSLLQKAFNGNAALSDIKIVNTPFEEQAVFVLFDPSVVQFTNDDINDFYGICTTLYQEIAKEVFRDVDSVHFCTDINGSLPQSFDS